jgi:hypothetical protein
LGWPVRVWVGLRSGWPVRVWVWVGLRLGSPVRVWVGGPVPPGADAITLGSLVIVRRRAAGDQRLLAHEYVHVRQWRALGVAGFLRRYLGSYLRWRVRGYPHRGAYLRIPLEIEADWLARSGALPDGSAAPPAGATAPAAGPA